MAKQVSEWAKEKAKMVYWRTCSTCGDVDRDSLALALDAAAEEVALRMYWEIWADLSDGFPKFESVWQRVLDKLGRK